LDIIYFESDPTYTHPFYQKHIVFTGALEAMTRSSAAKLIRDVGGILQGAVNEQTNFVVLGNKRKGVSSKELKARLLEAQGNDLQIINEADFFWLIQMAHYE
jgi:NAD-dependent DNA ligase